MPIDPAQIHDLDLETAFIVSAFEGADGNTRHDIVRDALVKVWNARGTVDAVAVAQLLGASGAGAATGAVSGPQAARTIKALDMKSGSG